MPKQSLIDYGQYRFQHHQHLLEYRQGYHEHHQGRVEYRQRVIDAPRNGSVPRSVFC